MSAPRFANFAIGGTEKAGTTSVFDWLSAHPQVGASSIKETDFFRRELTGDIDADARRYAGYFGHCDAAVPVLMEASPGYLGEAATVAPRIRALAPQMKILFILRDPIDRLYSSYQFHRGKLDLPQELAFDEYVTRCLDYDRRTRDCQDPGLGEWYLKVMRFGCYADFIARFRAEFPPENIKVMFFEALRDDERAFMCELSGFLRIDPVFWSNFGFRRSNVTFSGRNRALHKLAVKTNGVVEPLMRRHPGVKRTLVRAYKAVNQARQGYDPMPAWTRARLVDFYRPSIHALQRQLDSALPEAWHYLAHGTAVA